MTDSPTTAKKISFSAPSGPTRERAPKSTSTATRKASDKDNVTAALTVMQSAYAVMGLGLMAFAGPITAELLADSVDELQTANRQAFEASPKLAALIASAGIATGVGTFVGAHVMTLAPVAMSARRERAARAAEKAEERARASQDFVS